MVAKGRFREDLYWRINVLPVYVPPLRERREDIAALASLFLKRFNEYYNMDKKLAPDVLRCLQNYPWPGNIRELENTLEQMAVMTPGSTITLGDLPPNLRNESNSDIERWQGIPKRCSSGI